MTNQPADGERGHLCLRQDCMNTRAHLVQVNQNAENLNDWLAKSEAALAAAAEQLREKDEELKRLGERLAAAERFRFGSCLFSCSNNGWECYRLSDGSYLGDPPHSNTFIFKTFDDAYLAAVAANWLPQPEQQGGG